MGLWGGRGLVEKVRDPLAPLHPPLREWRGDCPLMPWSDSNPSSPSPVPRGVIRREPRSEPPAEWRYWLLQGGTLLEVTADMFWTLRLSEGGALALSNLSWWEKTFKTLIASVSVVFITNNSQVHLKRCFTTLISGRSCASLSPLVRNQLNLINAVDHSTYRVSNPWPLTPQTNTLTTTDYKHHYAHGVVFELLIT